MDMQVVRRSIKKFKKKNAFIKYRLSVHRVSEYGSHNGIVPACVGFLCDKVAVVEDKIKGTSVNLRN